MLFVLDLDNPDPKKPRGKPARKPVDLDAPVESTTGAKGESKLEILRDVDPSKKKRARIDPVKEERKRVVVSSILVVATLAAIALVAMHFLNKDPTFEQAKDGALPVMATPLPQNRPAQIPGRAQNPVVPNQQRSPLDSMPGLSPGEDRTGTSAHGGIN